VGEEECGSLGYHDGFAPCDYDGKADALGLAKCVSVGVGVAATLVDATITAAADSSDSSAAVATAAIGAVVAVVAVAAGDGLMKRFRMLP
jgi:acetylornithine/succinyldiaminopimelate/putrescine aminotransferase